MPPENTGVPWLFQRLLLCFLDNDYKCKAYQECAGRCEAYLIHFLDILNFSFKSFRMNIEQHIFQPCLCLNSLGCNYCIPRKWSLLMVTSPLTSGHSCIPTLPSWEDSWGAEKSSPGCKECSSLIWNDLGLVGEIMMSPWWESRKDTNGSNLLVLASKSSKSLHWRGA